MEKKLGKKTYELVLTPDFELSCRKCDFGMICKTEWTECMDRPDTPQHWKLKTEQ